MHYDFKHTVGELHKTNPFTYENWTKTNATMKKQANKQLDLGNRLLQRLEMITCNEMNPSGFNMPYLNYFKGGKNVFGFCKLFACWPTWNNIYCLP